MEEYHNKSIISDPFHCLGLLCYNTNGWKCMNSYVAELNQILIKQDYKILYLYQFSDFSIDFLSHTFHNVISTRDLNLNIDNIKSFLVDDKEFYSIKNFPFLENKKIYTSSEDSFSFNFSVKDIKRFI